jgi:hypothetical protein
MKPMVAVSDFQAEQHCAEQTKRSFENEKKWEISLISG